MEKPVKNYVQVGIRLSLEEYEKLKKMASKQKFSTPPQTVARHLLKEAIANAR